MSELVGVIQRILGGLIRLYQNQDTLASRQVRPEGGNQGRHITAPIIERAGLLQRLIAQIELWRISFVVPPGAIKQGTGGTLQRIIIHAPSIPEGGG